MGVVVLSSGSGDSPRACLRQPKARSPLREEHREGAIVDAEVKVCALERQSLHKAFICENLIFEPVGKSPYHHRSARPSINGLVEVPPCCRNERVIRSRLSSPSLSNGNSPLRRNRRFRLSSHSTKRVFRSQSGLGKRSCSFAPFLYAPSCRFAWVRNRARGSSKITSQVQVNLCLRTFIRTDLR